MKLLKNISLIALSIFVIGCISCSNNNDIAGSGTINEGNDPNFKIVKNTDAAFSNFPKKITVFDIPIYAVSGVEDVKLLHAANVMAQYLDNNEDGTVDNPTVLNTMKANKAFLFMWKSQSDMNNMNPPNGYTGQDLGADETNPTYVSSGKKGRFDASLEEVWHLITHAGYSKAYPNALGENAGTTLTNAMDKARGGKFTSIPSSYPAGAWYTYDDSTCTYDCQATEYFYWAMTSILGAQDTRLNEIQQEWKLNTKAKVQATDKDVYALLTDAQYKFPTVLPDGTYKR
ncbi:hypothetical protein WH52_04665 [Tenacibaculum holothuriorum]|uniref:Lipoprotein n=1 Tax=Tenacibaculum holothuriorum TaxID=1635173 RepID=A0A1Y2PFL2_9FLAO|nr:hypothetical protein [Tenacibaculum holothuriorum]OSY88960.1 hypothetical protein WH52_04665 [Tenacibaculum holothuriorum]